jgi:hypothetical protein
MADARIRSRIYARTFRDAAADLSGRLPRMRAIALFLIT